MNLRETMEMLRKYFMFLYDFHLLLSVYDFHLISLFHFLILLLGLWTLLSLVCSLAGPVLMLFYPLYKSIMAMESTSEVDYKEWIAYWIFYYCFSLMETVFQPILNWIPIWYPMKVIFVAWLVLPQFKGATFLYKRLREQIKKYKDGHTHTPIARDINAISNFHSWFRNRLQDIQLHKDDRDYNLSALFSHLSWNIWKSINKCAFERILCNTMVAIENSMKDNSEFRNHLEKSRMFIRKCLQHDLHEEHNGKWVKPSDGFIKFNCDGSYSNDHEQKGGVGIIARNSYGFVIFMRHLLLFAPSSNAMECYAVLHSLLSAQRLGFDKIMVESNNSQLVTDLVNGTSTCPLESNVIIKDILGLSSLFEVCSFCFVSHRANKPANWIANQALKGSLPPLWETYPPFVLNEFLIDDVSSSSV